MTPLPYSRLTRPGAAESRSDGYKSGSLVTDRNNRPVRVLHPPTCRHCHGPARREFALAPGSDRFHARIVLVCRRSQSAPYLGPDAEERGLVYGCGSVTPKGAWVLAEAFGTILGSFLGPVA